MFQRKIVNLEATNVTHEASCTHDTHEASCVTNYKSKTKPSPNSFFKFYLSPRRHLTFNHHLRITLNTGATQLVSICLSTQL